MEPTTNPQTTALDVNFAVDDPEELPVALDRRAALRAKRLEDKIASEKLGVRVMKLRLNTYRIVKRHIDALGLKTMGQCNVLIANDKVESVLEELDALAQETDADVSSSKELRMELRRLKLECIKVMMASGTEQMKADRQPIEQPSSGHIQFPFPSGTPIAVAIGTRSVEKPNQIEGGGNKG